MIENPSKAFEAIIAGLEAKRASLTEKRRNFTKNIVAQTNEEARSGMPYLVDVAGMIARANGAELFLDGLINGLRSDSRNLGESVAVKRALSSVLEQVKFLEPGNQTGDVPAAELYEIGRYLMDSLSGVVLRDAES